MHPKQPEPTASRWQWAGENLRRLKASGVYYGFIKRGGKQISQTLKTTDKATAKRLLKDWLAENARQVTGDAARITFEELAAQWLAAKRHTLKPGSA